MRQLSVTNGLCAECIKKRRKSILHSALRQLQTKIKLLHGYNKNGTKRPLDFPQSCTQERRSEECDAYHLGLLMRALVAEDITPHALPRADMVYESLHDFDHRLTRIYDAVAESVPLLGKVHAKCNPMEQIITRLKEQRDTFELELNSQQRAHFIKQSSKRSKKDWAA